MDRPNDYYRLDRTILFSQGDIFDGVPFLEVDDEGNEIFRRSRAMLITPTQVMRARGATDEGSYATPVRLVVPVLPVETSRIHNREALVEDELLHYMYLPGDDAIGLPECVAVLSEPTLSSHSELKNARRLTQLTVDATRQLQRKLVVLYTMIRRVPDRHEFDPWAD
jgi:hypothetical protein